MKINYTKSEKKAFEWLSTMLERSHNDVNSSMNMSSYEELKIWVDSTRDAEMVSESKIEDPKFDKKAVAKKPIPKKTKPAKKSSEEPLDTSGLVCNEHKSYQGMRTPRTDCDECWALYKKLHFNEYPSKRRAFEAKMRLSNGL
jgi:hypothetical protein